MLAKVQLTQDEKSLIKHSLTIDSVDFSNYAFHVELDAGNIPKVYVEMNGVVPMYTGNAEILF